MKSLNTKLVNRVANSKLVTINMEHWYPSADFAAFDLKDYLWKELILKEKDFREALKTHNWEQYQGKTLLVFCSTDAIIPVWAFMLVSKYAAPIATEVYAGNQEEYLKFYYDNHINTMDFSLYEDQMLVIKGCSEKPVPHSAYLTLTKRLTPIARSIMYGEPCSTVPIYKKPKN